MISQRQQYVDNLSRLLVAGGKNSFEKLKNRLSLVVSRLDTLSPLRILARGYAVTRKLPGRSLVRSVGDVEPGCDLETIVADGVIVSRVEAAEKKKT